MEFPVFTKKQARVFVLNTKPDMTHKNKIMNDSGLIKVTREILSSAVNLLELKDYEIHELCAIKEQHWPHSISEQRRWWHENSDCTDVIVRIYREKALIAFLRLREREVFSRDVPHPARCVTEVCVDQRVIGTGVGRFLMSEVVRYLDEEKIKIGYLLCTSGQEHFYAQCGWHLVPTVTIRKDLLGEIQFLDEERCCFVYDPDGVVCETILLTGKVF
ncbi:hypothetical protein WH96_20230 [Kiloniella spongiae]|uniref:N-acetyltransferase domain-containing protein n=1 Tax=Kiloniella spongiae TaxID=1489064 RepID=A0A0H2M9I3_9PROT|nr:GNAT family N-acetyltransferase [Kiloniella spongiae]KLN58953.1 hypothetical protein WH96_20230 [Kiloniella spongiae]